MKKPIIYQKKQTTMTKIEKLHELYTAAADALWEVKWHRQASQTIFLDKNYRREKISAATKLFVGICKEITMLQFGSLLDEMDFDISEPVKLRNEPEEIEA